MPRPAPLRRLTPSWPLAIIALASAILFADLIFGGRALYWGTPLLQFYPWRDFALNTLRAGYLPLWNPYLGMGAPLIANYQSAIFYPPNWLLLLVPLDLGLGWLAVAHVVFAGAGMLRLARRIGLGELGQAVVGLSFALSGYVVARLGFITINNAVAWLPWLALAADRLAGARSARAVAGLSAVLALQLLAGHAQIAWYSILLAAAWFGWRSVQLRGLRRSARALAAFGMAALLAAGAAAIQLLPTFELLRLSERASPEQYEFIATYSFWPWRLAGLVAPDLFGNPARGDYWGYGNYWEDAIYVGVLPLILAIGATIGGIRSRTAARRRQRSAPEPTPPGLVPFLTASLAVSLAVALGKFAPFFPLLYRFVPTFNLFQAPARMMLGFGFAASLLAGIGAEGWRTPEGRALYWTRLGAAAGLAVSLGAGLASAGLDVRSTFLRALAVAGGWLFGSAVMALIRPKTGARWWTLAAAAFVAADLILAGRGLNPTTSPEIYRASLPSAESLRAEIGAHRTWHPEAAEDALKYERLFRFDTFARADPLAARASLLPNTGMMQGIASANNFEPLRPAWYERWMRLVDHAAPSQSAKLLRLMDVRAIVTPSDAPPGFAIRTLEDSAERAWVVYSARFVADESSALAAVASADFDPEREVVLIGEGSPKVEGQAEVSAVPVQLTPDPNVVTIPVFLEAPGFLVLSDTYYPGWRASVDGRPVPVLRADYAFRAVALGAGQHLVEFRYLPPSFAAGAWISAAAWAGILLAWLVRSRQPDSSSRDADPKS